MNHRRPYLQSPSRTPKLAVYGLLLTSLFLVCIALLKHKIRPDPNIAGLRELQIRGCNVTDEKRRLIAGLEPLISKEPLDVWEGLGKEEKNVKYLPSLTGLPGKDRIVYIDLGAREYDSSIGSWFVRQYPKQGKPYVVYAVEADRSFHKQYESRPGVTLLPYAAWIRNETVVFGSKPIIVKDRVWRMRPFGRIEGEKAEGDGLSAVVRVPAFDFVEWLAATVRETDFVVVKMDVEGTEIALVRELVRRGAICLIDELFMECHFDRYVKCCSGERINRFNYTYGQCYDLFAQLREMGVVAHQWW
ncbi:conserved peptide upstream open reading frame 47 [Striga asiatica]|uniref:Conserved peptide upstream open reading frame 47 n=1 Tax=Striga asiatica TaxID=4170 RepID=A0A5A7PVD2_STRAF|nr:conserved peptide upstream open reading frame 47 [Striga asiatica]